MTDDNTGDTENETGRTAEHRHARLRVIAGTEENRPTVDVGNADISQTVRQMAPVMAQSGKWFRYAEGLALIQEYTAPPRLLVNVDGDGKITSEPVMFTAPVLVEPNLAIVEICNQFIFAKFSHQRRQMEPCQPTASLASQLVAQRGFGLPPLKAVVDYPVIGTDKKIVTAEDHYDKELSIFFAKGRRCEITKYTDPHKAYKFLRTHWLGEFEFKSEADFWHSLCYAASLLMRRTVLSDGEGNPVFIFTAPLSSSGKTALVQALYLAVCGRNLPVNPTEMKDQVELKKALFAVALSNVPAVLFDNAPRGIPIRSTAIEAYATADEYKDRILGLAREATASTLAIIAVTGNNIEAGGDLPNRSITIRLSPKTKNPALRKYKKNLKHWTVKNRSKILGALECLLQQECADEDKPQGRYPAWNDAISGPMIGAARVNGFKDDLFEEWMQSAEGENTKDEEVDALCKVMEERAQEGYFASELKEKFPRELMNLFGLDDDKDLGTAAEQLKKMNGGTIVRKLSVFRDYVATNYRLTTEDRYNKETRKKSTSYHSEKLGQDT